MLILGIETSCDETSAAVIEGNPGDKKVKLLSNITASSLFKHAKTGGIIPETAAREQVKYIVPVIKEALSEANISINELDKIAVTYGPGLIGSLLVGVETAKTLSYVYSKKIVGVNHMLGHVYANFIDFGQEDIKFPAIALIASGGHTDLLLIKDHSNYEFLGGTRDDAAGECFDKCARLIGYKYPGGPKISKLAEKGDPKKFPFPKPMIGSKDYYFSFSGLKTAFLYTTSKLFPVDRNSKEKIGWQEIVLEENVSNEQKQTLYDLCSSLEEAIVGVLVRKTISAAKKYNASSILLSGGVAANQKLRKNFEETISRDLPNTIFHVPKIDLCMDNAAMIASAAFYGSSVKTDWKKLSAKPSLYFE